MKNCKQDLLLPSGQCSSDLERCKRENCNQWQPMTNYDRIRNMSVEELAEFLANETFRIAKPVFDFIGYGIEKQVIYARRKQWLESEVTE